jgi:hypothetical protein
MGFGRKTDPNPRRLPQWDHTFDADVEVPYKIDGRLSFVNVTVPLSYNGVMLSILDNNDDALKWTQRLIYRWQQGKDSKTGLCGGLLNNFKHDRAKMTLRHIHPKINEAKLVASYNQTCRYHELPLAQIQSGETLLKAGGKYAEVGCKFIIWALEDLKIYADRCYDADTEKFTSMMTDGTPLQWQKAKKGYYYPEALSPRDPDETLLWGYAMAYRISKDKTYWNMVRQCGKFMGIGDIGLPNGKEQALNFDTDKLDHRIIYTLLELYRATDDRSMMQLACRIGDNLVKSQTETGLFPKPGRKYARTGSDTPLVLLHLAAVIDGKSNQMPMVPIFDTRFFACEYYNPGKKTEIYDNAVFYGW